MRFSIIIPVYNVEKYLSKCLDSVLTQSFTGWEAICVNDGSTDGSGAILEEYAKQNSQFTVIAQANGGLSAARNTGLEAAKGDYVLFLDSDDWLETDALQIISANLQDEDLLCFSGRRYFEENRQYEDADQLVEESSNKGWDYYSQNALKPRRFAFVCVVLRCYKRRFLLDNGLYFKPGLYHEDNLFTPLVCFFAHKTRVIPDVLYDYRVRGKSIMTSRSLKHWMDVVRIANELAAFFVPKTGIEKRTIYQALTHHYQVSLANVPLEYSKELRHIVDWGLYRSVSRTKLRHRILYSTAKISSRLFKTINRFIS